MISVLALTLVTAGACDVPEQSEHIIVTKPVRLSSSDEALPKGSYALKSGSPGSGLEIEDYGTVSLYDLASHYDPRGFFLKFSRSGRLDDSTFAVLVFTHIESCTSSIASIAIAAVRCDGKQLSLVDMTPRLTGASIAQMHGKPELVHIQGDLHVEIMNYVTFQS